jgi:hypothetical protein
MTMLRRFISLCTLTVLAACGGGGGSSGDAPFGPGGGTGGGTTPRPPTIAVTVSPSTVTAAAPGTVRATVSTAAGAPIPGQVVTFTTTGSLGKFSAPSALTDDSGVATVTVTPATASTAGADSVVASTTVGTAVLTATAGFQLTATNVSIASFTSDLGTAALAPYGQTALTVTLSPGAAGNPVTINVSSSCVTRGLATLTPASATTSTGTATFTLRDNGCGADLRDTLQASVSGTTSTASLQITLTPPSVASISFTSASPETIFLRGSGFVENSTVTFTVRDAAGNGVRGQTVRLEPTTTAGGLRVDDQSTGFPLSKQTDINGNVLVRVNSGTVPTPVRIRASITVGTTEVSTVSSTLAIAVGLPSQLNFSLSQGTTNIEGYNRDGTPNTYQIIASDRLGNPVPDGTAINFIAEGGQVQAIRQTTTTNGLSRAVANFQTSSPVPTDGRVTVLAYALGEKSFIDANGDNIFTDGELFQDLGDPYLDRLFNGVFTSAPNQFVEQTPAGSAACAAPGSPLLALDVSVPTRPATCTGGWGRAYVRRAIETVFSTSSARPIWGTSLPSGSAVPSGGVCPAGVLLTVPNSGSTFPAYAANGTPTKLTFYEFGGARLYNLGGAGVISFLSSDANPVAFNPMAAGTTITVAATDGITASVAGGTPVPSTSAPTGVAINYKFDTASTGVITVTLRSPSGLATSISQFIASGAAPAGSVSCP